MRRWLMAALKPQAPHTAELCVQIVSAAEMTALNSQFRQQPYATNVLSFPAEVPEFIDLPLLGDIVICAEVVNREAREQHKTRDAHWAHMLVHGGLHLLGYDHLEDADAEVMEALETDIITGFGFPPPYQPQEPAAVATGEAQ
jgi:probable rRNA maturation factor